MKIQREMYLWILKELLGYARQNVLGITLCEVLGETLENVDANMLSEALGFLL